MKDDREIEFWSVDDSREELICRYMDDAIDEYLDEIDRPVEPGDTVEVFGYARRKVELDYEWILKLVLEELDQEYSNIHQESTVPNGKMIDAAREFVDTICKAYEPWACEVVCKETIDLYEWCKENDQELLKENNTEDAEECI